MYLCYSIIIWHVLIIYILCIDISQQMCTIHLCNFLALVHDHRNTRTSKNVHQFICSVQRARDDMHWNKCRRFGANTILFFETWSNWIYRCNVGEQKNTRTHREKSEASNEIDTMDNLMSNEAETRSDCARNECRMRATTKPSANHPP